MEFSDAEFTVLDLVSEDSYSIGELGYLEGDQPNPALTIELLRELLTRELITLHASSSCEAHATQQSLSSGEAHAALDRIAKSAFQSDDWFQYEAFATDAGKEAYERAYRERH